MGRKSRQKAKQKHSKPKRGDVAAPGPGAVVQRNESLLLGTALVGLAVSALLYAEYVTPGSGLCSVVGGGCDAVRMSGWSSIGGVSLPTLGILFFLSLIAATLTPAARAALLPLALLGGLAGVVFIAVQGLVIGAWCPFCLIVDVAAIAAAALAWTLRRAPADPVDVIRVGTVTVLAVIALGFTTLTGVPAGDPASSASGGSTVGPLPPVVAELQKQAPVTVVEFLDFQCPACGAQHRIFREVLADLEYDVHFEYLHAPLPQHPHAADAARAYICAAEQGRGSEMADALFLSAAPDAEETARFAEGLGLDANAFARCLASERTAEQLRVDDERATRAGLRSLPTFWIGDRKFEGVQQAGVVRQALDRLAARAASPSEESGRP